YDSVEDFLQRNHEVIPDIILLLDVIEHIEDDKAFLTYLKNSGVVGAETRLLITVPAYQKLFSSHDVYLKHYRRYTVKSLKESLSAAGMISLRNGYFFTSLVMARSVQKLLGIGDKIDEQKGISAYKPKPILDQVFFGILMADFHLIKLFRLIGIKFPGLSCFSICKLNEA
ncbi:MAG: hypothetical protein GVX78_03930, partial [Bacteroidetes bacterium]|nr:hypothetical protein [Bacteroidota bacterium]